jgi:GTP-binding protein
VFDGREGLTPLDEEIARWLRHENTPVIVAANKCEGNAGEAGRVEAFALGFGEPFALSAEHGEGLVDLFEALRPHLEPELAEGEVRPTHERGDDEDYVGPLKLAIVGRPNAGKSTLVNKMLDEDRMITGPEAGITRDSISIDWHWTDKDGVTHPVRLIDTAGLRKRAKVDDKLERLSAHDTKRAIDFAEVVVLLLDATRGLEAQDLRIADQVVEEGRALLIALNKWDLAENASSLFNGV